MAAASYADALRATPAENKKRELDQENQFNTAADPDEAVPEAHDTMSADDAMAWSMAKAVREDNGTIAAAETEGRQATKNLEMALQLEPNGSIGSSTPRMSDDPTRTPNHEVDVDDELIQKFETLHNNANEDDNENAGPRAASSSSSVAAQTVRPTLKRACAACDDHVPLHELAICPCSHEYCPDCIERVVMNSVTDEAFWPPRCCRQRIQAEEPHIRIFLSEQVMRQYSAKKLEMDTPDRTYCHGPACARFIPPQAIRDGVGTCPACEATTCALCGAAAHLGVDCHDDEAGQQLLELARQEGWKQCFSCHSVVALSDGCNHMSKYTSGFPSQLAAPPFPTHLSASWGPMTLTLRPSPQQHAAAAPSSATPAARGGTPGRARAR